MVLTSFSDANKMLSAGGSLLPGHIIYICIYDLYQFMTDVLVAGNLDLIYDRIYNSQLIPTPTVPAV